MPVTKICESCKKEFRVSPRRADEVKYCSRACKTEAGWLSFICRGCGSEVRRKKSGVGRSENLYCSRKCYSADRIGKSPVRVNPASEHLACCVSCKKEFRITATRRGIARWCSRECQAKDLIWRRECSEVEQGNKHWRWSGGKYKTHSGYIRYKKRVEGKEEATFNHRIVMLESMLQSEPEHPFILDVLGEKKLNPEIEVHHINRDRADNAFDNLLAVTKQAHAQIHHRNKRPNPWECWPRNPVKW